MYAEDEAPDTSVEHLVQRVAALRESLCSACGRGLCGHELLFNIASGAERPQCVSCLAAGLAISGEEMRNHFLAHFQRRACYGEVWQQENEREGFDIGSLPGCLWPPDATNYSHATRTGIHEQQEHATVIATLHVDDAWDAGDMTCGELLLALRQRMRVLPSRAILKLTARDRGAQEDIPAWCRLTGHRLLEHRHPEYWIQRRE